jgi:hypothetical protein
VKMGISATDAALEGNHVVDLLDIVIAANWRAHQLLPKEDEFRMPELTVRRLYRKLYLSHKFGP